MVRLERLNLLTIQSKEFMKKKRWGKIPHPENIGMIRRQAA